MTDARWSDRIAELDERERAVDEGGGPARVARQRRLGRWTVRERVAALVDEGSFVELERHVVHRHEASSAQLAANRHPGDGVVAGFARVGGRAVGLYAHDPTVMRGALGHAASRKICRVLDRAREASKAGAPMPVIALADSDGARVDEGTDAIDAYGEVIHRAVLLQPKSLQITLVSGLCVGAAAYAAAVGDLVAMVEGQSWMFITGPKVTKVVTGEDTTLDDLGGPLVHATKTGQCHAVTADEASGVAWVKTILGCLSAADASDPTTRETPELETIVPLADRRAYDMKKVLAAVFDASSVVELSPRFGSNLITAFARMGGKPVAVIASQPMVLAGCIDIDASRKGAHFVRLADKLGLPIVTLVDVPGYLPGTKQEHGGILPHGSLLLSAYGSATVPLVCLVVRKSYGGASVLSFAADVRLALPSAAVGPMGADAAMEVVFGPERDDATDAEKAERAESRAAWLAKNESVWAPAESGYVDRVVRPADVRRVLAETLASV